MQVCPLALPTQRNTHVTDARLFADVKPSVCGQPAYDAKFRSAYAGRPGFTEAVT
jgi:hypothetical protein